MSLLRAWAVLLLFWLAAMALIMTVRHLSRRQWLGLAHLMRWALLGAVLSLGAAAALIHWF